MDISEPNDDMEISSDAGHLLPPGEDLDIDLASMRDPSVESDSDFMVEDVVQETHMDDEGMAMNVQEHNDDEMFDGDIQDEIAPADHEHVHYNHDIQDEFDDTTNTVTDQHYDMGPGLTQVDANDRIPHIDDKPSNVPDAFADTFQAEHEQDNAHAVTINQDENPNPNQNLPGNSTNLERPETEERTTKSDPSRPGQTPPQIQVSEEVAVETTTITAEPEQSGDSSHQIHENQGSQDNLQSPVQHGSNDHEYSQEELHGAAEDHEDNNHRPADEFEGEASSELHPVKVLHEGSEVFLFPPMDEDSSATFFLHDDSLSQQGLNVLLEACREVLGSSINDEEELEIEFHDLGLHTSEVCPILFCFQC
jgi:hypothetical protein